MKKKTLINEVKQFQKIAGIIKEEKRETWAENNKRLMQAFRQAKIDPQKPAYCVTGWGRGHDVYKVPQAQNLLIDIMEEAGKYELDVRMIQDPEATAGYYEESFKEVIDREQLVPKLEVESQDVETGWEIWQ